MHNPTDLAVHTLSLANSVRFFHRARYLNRIVFVTVAMLVPISPIFAVEIGLPVQIGTISNTALREVSGIIDGRATPNTFWVHNDSGDSARFFAINHQGDWLGTFPLSGVLAVDWEDIAIAPKPSGGNYLYLGDIGDNNLVRSFVSVYRTDEPQTTTSATILPANYSTARLQYPGGVHRNAESLFVDPLTSDVFILTKSTAGTEIYSAPGTSFQDSTTTLTTTTMTSLGTLGVLLRSATAADISPDGLHILVRSKTVGYLFERSIGQSVADALHGTGVFFTLGPELQGEAIGWAADGTGFYTTGEWDAALSAPIHYYAFTPTPPLLPGDFNRDNVVDAADYTTWQDGLGVTFNASDYDTWIANFGNTGPGATLTVTVPEPANWPLGTLAMATVGLQRKQRRCTSNA